MNELSTIHVILDIIDPRCLQLQGKNTILQEFIALYFQMIPARKRLIGTQLEPLPKSQLITQSISQIAISLKNLADRLDGIFDNQQKMKAASAPESSSRFTRMEERFQRVKLQIPTLPANKQENREEREHQIQIWLGNLCQEVFSITFSMFEYEKLNDRKAKAYCCQNILANIIKMIKQNNLTSHEISRLDICLKEELIPYFLMKYPMSEDSEINQEFANKIVEIDSALDNQNDLVFKSKISFDYKQDGNYNRQIMSFVNYIIDLPSFKVGEKEETLYKSFCNDMENFFKKVQSEQFTLHMSKYNIRDLDSVNDRQIVTGKKNLTFEEEKLQETYRENVRAYTKKLIGRKISENVKPFSQIQINEGELKLKSPAIMRIITKWCQELMDNFDTTRNILNKENQFRMKDGSEKILKRKHLIILTQILRREKKKVDEYLRKVNLNNSQCQFDFSTKEVPKNMKKFSEQQCEVGLFAASVISNYQTYLVGYLNTIIHSLMSATRCYQEMVKAYEYKHDEYGEYIEKWINGSISFEDLINRAYSYRLVSVPVSYISFIPQLVSFRVGDILRCKCTSKEKEIIALYTELERMSRKKDSGLKIMRIKNRLEKGTKDILINFLYRNKILVEMQLAIATNRTKFIDFSNKYNHVLYELRRAEFGPISEMCNIWINNDIKADFYISQSRMLNARQNNHKTSDHVCSGSPIEFPFRCSQCLYFYTDCNYVLKHIECQVRGCRKLICSLCRAEKFTYDALKKVYTEIPSIDVLGMKTNQIFEEYRKRLSSQGTGQFMQGQESFGMLIDLKGEDRKPIYYKNLRYGRKNFIIQIKSVEKCEMVVMKQLITSEQIRAFKKQYLIFSSKKLYELLKPVEGEALNRIITEHNFPILMKKWLIKEKETIVFINGNLKDQDISKLDMKFPYANKICFYQNELTNLQPILNTFNESEIVDLGENKIERLTISDGFPDRKTHMKVLYINYNRVHRIDPSFIDKFKNLEELELSNNALKDLPPSFVNFEKLKILNLSRNLFNRLPEEVTKLKQLQILNLYESKNKGEKLIELPESFGNLVNLKTLNLNMNNLTRLPSSIGNLANLQIFYAIQNALETLPDSFSKLKQLKILNLASNNFKTIPVQIGSLDNLEILNLQNSCKTQDETKRLPQSYCNLVSMKMMDISQNYITELPANIGSMSMLETLFIYENKIKQLPESIGNLKLLRLLYASNNLLKKLPNSICLLQNLQKLTIKENCDLSSLPSELGKLKKLKSLISNGNSLVSLPESIGELQNLRQLVLKDNQIRKLPVSLRNLNQIVRLELDMDKLDQESRKIFVK